MEKTNSDNHSEYTHTSGSYNSAHSSWATAARKPLPFTLRAGHAAIRTLWSELEVRFLLPGVKAVCAQAMRNCTALYFGLEYIRRNVRSDFGLRVAFRLSIPAFQLSNFFFKLTYALGERHLALLRGDRDALRANQLGVHLGNSGDQLVKISQALVRLFACTRSHSNRTLWTAPAISPVMSN